MIILILIILFLIAIVAYWYLSIRRRQKMEKQERYDEEKIIDPKIHRRILRFLNAARRPEDLMHRPIREIPLYDGMLMKGVHKDEPEDELVKESKRIPLLLDKELAKRVFEEREEISPIYGFKHIRQLLEIKGFDARFFGHLTAAFSAAVNGRTFNRTLASRALPRAVDFAGKAGAPVLARSRGSELVLVDGFFSRRQRRLHRSRRRPRHRVFPFEPPRWLPREIPSRAGRKSGSSERRDE